MWLTAPVRQFTCNSPAHEAVPRLITWSPASYRLLMTAPIFNLVSPDSSVGDEIAAGLVLLLAGLVHARRKSPSLHQHQL